MKTRLIGATLAVLLTIGGTLMLTGYVRGADERAANGAALVSVYVVRSEIPEGTAAADLAEYIGEDQVPASAAVAARVTSLTQLEGLVAGTTLLPGEQLLSARWVDPAVQAPGVLSPPDGMQAISIALPMERVVGGLIAPGDTVGIVIAGQRQLVPGAPEVPVSQQVFHGVLVLAVDGGAASAAGTAGTAGAAGTVGTLNAGATGTTQAVASVVPDGTVLVTLALTSPDIERLVWGQQFGTVWLTRDSTTENNAASSPVDAAAVFR
jgi:Flp pilus assembly protein CpaB